MLLAAASQFNCAAKTKLDDEYMQRESSRSAYKFG